MCSGTVDSSLPSTFPHTDSMDVACSPWVDGQEVWPCQTELDVGASVALDAGTFWLCRSSLIQLTLVQQVQLPGALRRN